MHVLTRTDIREEPARRRAVPALGFGIVALAGASLVLPSAISYDPWAWLVWGREVLRLDLDTTGGPSWKPLPVVGTSVLALFGGFAPTLWLVVARAGGLLLVAGTFRLAARFAGAAAGLVAVAVLVLAPDPEPRFLRTVVEGHVAPMAAACAVWAVDRHLEGRCRQALLLGAALALMRPESWPLLGAYAAWLWRREPATRPVAVATAVAVPVLWLGGDWWGSGDPLHGAASAQVGVGAALERLGDGLGTVGAMVTGPAWVAAGLTVAAAWQRRRHPLLALAAGAALWCLLVVGMAFALGYAALSRFLLPAVAVVAALAGVGVAELLADQRARTRWLLPAVAGLAAVPFLVPRVLGLADVADEVVSRGRHQDDLPAAIEHAGGRDRVVACGDVAVEGSSLLRPAVAWHLDVPLHRLTTTPTEGPAVALVLSGGREDRRLADGPQAGLELLGRSDRWAVYAVGCPGEP
ncbi:MAG: hypothetical protein ACLFXM_02460 [Acidimicrobiia bacterium]